MKRLSILVVIFTMLFIISCGSTKVERPNLNKVYVTNTNKVDVLPVSAISGEIDEYQMFKGTFKSKDGEQSLTATAYLHIDSAGIDIVLLNELGIELGTISYDGMSASVDSTILPKKFKAEYIILDLQNAYADSNLLKEHYKNYGLTFEEVKSNITTQNGAIQIGERRILKKDKLIESINIGNGTITITNHLRGYEFKFTRLEN